MEPSPASTQPAPVASASPAADPLPAGVFNVLLFGTDSRDKQSLSGNSDAIVVAQLSADRKRLTLVSIARDSYVPIGGKGSNKINAAFAFGGTPLLRSTVSDLLGGLPIHATVQANFSAFISLTRALGGIRVTNKHASKPTVNSTGRVLDFHTGELLLENTDALIYARERKSLPLGDLDRAERHRALVIGILKGLQQVVTKKPAAFDVLIKGLAKNLKITDFDPAKVADLAVPLQAVDLTKVTSLLVPIARFDDRGGASVDIVDDAQNAELGKALKAGDVAAYVRQHGTGYAPGA